MDLVQFLIDLLTYADDSVKARVYLCVWKTFGSYVMKRCEMGHRKKFCTLLALSLLPKYD